MNNIEPLAEHRIAKLQGEIADLADSAERIEATVQAIHGMMLALQSSMDNIEIAEMQ